MPFTIGLRVFLFLEKTHTHTQKRIFHPLVPMSTFDWWGNRWQIAVSILMDDIIWPDVLITYAKPGARSSLHPSSTPLCLQLISGSFVHQLPLNLMHEEGEKLTWLLLPVPVPRLPSLLFHSSIHLYLEGSKTWQIQWHSVCLPSYADNQSVLNGPSAFRWIIVYTSSIIGGCLNGDLLKGTWRKMGSDFQPLTASVNVCSRHQTSADIVECFSSCQCVCQRIL